MEEYFIRPSYLWDFEYQFADLLDFIKFSEENLEWQRQSHIKRLDMHYKGKEYLLDEYFPQLDAIEYRFDFNLAQKIRYSAIIALVTTLEWVSKLLKDKGQKEEEVKKKFNGVNKHITRLREYYQFADCNLEHNFEELEKVIKIRNCITHSAGIIEDDEYPEQITEIVKTLKGFEVSDETVALSQYIGMILIDRGVIEEIIKRTESWIPDFIEECRQKNLIEISNTD